MKVGVTMKVGWLNLAVILFVFPAQADEPLKVIDEEAKAVIQALKNVGAKQLSQSEQFVWRVTDVTCDYSTQGVVWSRCTLSDKNQGNKRIDPVGRPAHHLFAALEKAGVDALSLEDPGNSVRVSTTFIHCKSGYALGAHKITCEFGSLDESSVVKKVVDSVLLAHDKYRKKALAKLKEAKTPKERLEAEEAIREYIQSPWSLARDVAALGLEAFSLVRSEEIRLYFLERVSGTDRFLYGENEIDDFLDVVLRNSDPKGVISLRAKEIQKVRRAVWIGKQRPEIGILFDDILNHVEANAVGAKVERVAKLLKETSLTDRIRAVFEISDSRFDKDLYGNYTNLRLTVLRGTASLKDKRMLPSLKRLQRRAQYEREEELVNVCTQLREAIEITEVDK